ncbi:MAG: NADPH-dependent oxidoreductase [Balneola sp.]|nr:MAG: NADPH-dependent oxidoreductase [Balneola sp.]
MKKRILAFGASSSKTSINKAFAEFAANTIENAAVTMLDLNDFEMPIYSIDRERESGIPEPAKRFKEEIKQADGLIISFAEHNGSYTAAFKNIMDWISRLEGSTWEHKPMLLLSTSPGGRGAKTVLNTASTSFKFGNSKPISSFSLPFFNKNFDRNEGILDQELGESFNSELEAFVTATDAEQLITT